MNELPEVVGPVAARAPEMSAHAFDLDDGVCSTAIWPRGRREPVAVVSGKPPAPIAVRANEF